MLNLSDDRVNFFPELPVRVPVSPRRLVHSGDAPAVTNAGTVDPVDAGDRAILDREGERGFGVEVERQCQRGADGAAMCDDDDVAPRTGLDYPVDRPRYAFDDRDET